MNYIDRLARSIHFVAGGGELSPDELQLYRIYAVLCLSAGERTTNRMVHDAWSAWRAATRPDHRSLVPFEQLSPEVQELDTPYRDAIRALAHPDFGPTPKEHV